MHLLVDYSSDSEEDSNVTNIEKGDGKRTERLPVPGVLLNNLKREEVNDDPAENEGRIRSFPHERGNWASHLYVPCERLAEMEMLTEQLISACSDCDAEVKAINSPHLSVSRTFVLLYHWIPEFISTVRSTLSSFQSFRVELGGLEVYVNDEGTRSFLGLTVSSGSEFLSQAVSLLDSCLSQYKLRPFYEEGSFHVSVCWCLGDKREYFKSILHRLNPIMNQFLVEHPSSSSINVSHLIGKIGNRVYTFNLIS